MLMNTSTFLETERLILRQWQPTDFDELYRLCSDPIVMEHFPSLRNEAETRELYQRLQQSIECLGFGFWAAALKDTSEFIGFIGLNVPKETLHFSPCVEVGWRLKHSSWGNGFATEGARAAIAFGFEQLGLAEIVAQTTKTNLRSQAVMRRLGMTTDESDDFGHPAIDVKSPLHACVLYRLRAYT